MRVPQTGDRLLLSARIQVSTHPSALKPQRREGRKDATKDCVVLRTSALFKLLAGVSTPAGGWELRFNLGAIPRISAKMLPTGCHHVKMRLRRFNRMKSVGCISNQSAVAIANRLGLSGPPAGPLSSGYQPGTQDTTAIGLGEDGGFKGFFYCEVDRK